MSITQAKKCYVIMPFSKFAGISQGKWTEAYEHIFKPAVESAELDYVCERSQIRNGAFIKDIIENLRNSQVVLADVTGFNANVMWELGIGHALSRRTILVARQGKNDKKINISDMSTYGVIVYSTTPAGIDAFKTRIKELLQDIDNNPDRNDNPVFDYLSSEAITISSVERRSIINKLNALTSELFANLDLAEGIRDKRMPVSKRVTQRRYILDAIKELLATNYAVLPDPEEEKQYMFTLRVMTMAMESCNISMNAIYSIDKYEHIAEYIINLSKDLAEDLPRMIMQTKKLSSIVRQGEGVDNEAPIITLRNEHKKLLE